MKTFLDGIAYTIVAVASLALGVLGGAAIAVGMLSVPLVILIPSLLAAIVWATLRVVNDRK